MSYTSNDIAQMIMAPFVSYESLIKKISPEWESAIAGKTLGQCIDEILNEYSRNIATETGYDDNRKIIALVVEIERRLKKIVASTTQNA